MSAETDVNKSLTIDKGLMDRVRDIVTRRNQIQDLLRKAEGNKSKVKPEIFKKVMADYEEKMKSVAAEYEPVSVEIKSALTDINLVEKELRRQTVESSDRLEELRFRCEVGEFSKEDLEKKESENVKTLKDLEARLRIVDSTYAECRKYIGDEDFEDAMASGGAQEAPQAEDKGGDDFVVAPDEVIDARSIKARKDDGGDVDISIPAPEIESQRTPPPRPVPRKPAAPAPTRSPAPKDDIDITLSDVDGVAIDRDVPQDKTDLDLAPSADTLESPAMEPPPELDDDEDDAPARAPAPPGADLDATISFGARSFLKLKKEDGAEETFILGMEPLSIGRNHKNDVVLLDRSISRKHAQVQLEGSGKYSIMDLSSGGGLALNGEKIKKAELKDGDDIAIGDFHLRFVEEPA